LEHRASSLNGSSSSWIISELVGKFQELLRGSRAQLAVPAGSQVLEHRLWILKEEGQQ